MSDQGLRNELGFSFSSERLYIGLGPTYGKCGPQQKLPNGARECDRLPSGSHRGVSGRRLLILQIQKPPSYSGDSCTGTTNFPVGRKINRERNANLERE